MRKHLELTFDGFWNERSIEKIPHESGVYVVFDGLLDDDGTSVSLERVIYIGASEDCAAAVQDSDMWEQWREQSGVTNITDDNDIPATSGEDNELFFSFAPIETSDAQRAAAAITFEQTPASSGEEQTTSFAYEDTKINLYGKTGLLNTDYEVVMDYADAPPEDDNRTDEFMDLGMK
jgi:hypothetical protein